MTSKTLKYSYGAMALHWSIAMLLAYNYGLGLRTEDRIAKADLFVVFQLHKSVGILILLLTLWRIWIRVTRPRPATLGDGGWAKTLSSIVHIGFYVIIIGLPVTGWIIVSTSDIKVPTLLFGLVPWPHLPLDGLPPWVGDWSIDAHELLPNAALGLVALHLAGVIRHQFLIRDDVIGRMAPAAKHGVTFLILVLALLGISYLLGRYGPPRSPLMAPAISKPILIDGPPATAPVRTADIAQPVEKAGPAQPAIDEPAEAADANRPVDEWMLRPGGKLGFSVVVNGETINGQFGRWDADIAFDPDRPSLASIDVRIDLSTATTGDGQRDAMLPEADFFATSSHPSARFKSESARALGNDRYSSRGTLTLKGISRPTTITFTQKIAGDTARVAGGTTIGRNDFLVGIGQWAGEDSIGHKVGINFSFDARRVPLRKSPPRGN